MKNTQLIIGVVCAMLVVSVYGCNSKPKAKNANEAVAQSKNMPDVKAQADYLVSEAKAFLNSKQYDEAMKTAQYIASNFQESAAEAQKIIEQSAQELQKEASAKMDEMKQNLSGIGK